MRVSPESLHYPTARHVSLADLLLKQLLSSSHSNGNLLYVAIQRARLSRAPATRSRLMSTSVKETQGKLDSLAQLQTASGWRLAPQNGYLAKTLQFKSFTDAWSFMSALALYSARHNHVSFLPFDRL